MEPIVFHKGDFPVELSRNRSYTDFSVSWNDGLCQFCVRKGCCDGWRYDVTTSGHYPTFAEAYAAAEKAATELAAGRKDYNDVCILHREDNKQNLIGSWGLSKAQSEELTSPPSDERSVEDLIRAGLQHSFHETMENAPPEILSSMKPSFEELVRNASSRQAEEAAAAKAPDHSREEKGRS